MTRRKALTYGTLLAIWLLLAGWQVAEHYRARRAAQVALINRGKDICNTLGLLLRSQRFFGVISKERLESALNALVAFGQVKSVVLLNNLGDVVASAGDVADATVKGDMAGGERWEETTVILENLVDLGTNVTQDLDRTIVIPSGEWFGRDGTNRVTFTNEAGQVIVTNAPRRRLGNRRRGVSPVAPFQRPEWMSESDYQDLIQKKGVHTFNIALSNQAFHAQNLSDLWLRCIIVALGAVAVAGCGLAARNLDTSSELQIRLIRASQSNTHLKEMNLAAAGLAHETRNPLNIIRGLAQMISRQPDSSAEIRQKALGVIEETDRVTAQLNEFINYSRPREIRCAEVSLRSITADVLRTLGCDLEEKNIRLRRLEEEFVVKADEPLLRQALFNLILNAVQAVDAGGEIRVEGRRVGDGEAVLDISDNGLGVPEEQRTEVFKPYFTTQKKGTGLGLAVVRQIVLAHGWEVECLPNLPRGAIFRLSHLKLASNS